MNNVRVCLTVEGPGDKEGPGLMQEGDYSYNQAIMMLARTWPVTVNGDENGGDNE